MATDNVDKDLLQDLRSQWGWMLAFGVALVLLGAIGLTMLFAFTIASVLYFGGLLLLGSGVQVVDVFKTRGVRNTLWHVLLALLYFAAGVVIFVDPVMASATLTLVLAAILVGIGVTRVIIAVSMRRVSAWGWMLLSGLLSAALGLMIVFGWPEISAWVIGLFVSLELLFFGWASIMLAVAIKSGRRLTSQAQQQQTA